MLCRETLSREHAELDHLADCLLHLTRAEMPAGAELSALRWELTRKLAQHLAKEDQLLFPAMRASRDARAAATARRFADEMGGLGPSYRAYVADWSADRIAREWPLFRTETARIMAALRDRIHREESELYPLLTR